MKTLLQRLNDIGENLDWIDVVFGLVAFFALVITILGLLSIL